MIDERELVDYLRYGKTIEDRYFLMLVYLVNHWIDENAKAKNSIKAKQRRSRPRANSKDEYVTFLANADMTTSFKLDSGITDLDTFRKFMNLHVYEPSCR